MPEDTQREQFDRFDRFRSDITFREAVEMFATKDALSGLVATIQAQGTQIAEVVSRHEHEARWKYEDARYQRVERETQDFNRKLTRLDDKLDDLMSHLPPKWLFPVLSIVVPVALVIVQVLLHTLIPQAVSH